MKAIKDVETLNQMIEEESMLLAVFSDIGCSVCLAIHPELEALEKDHENVSFVTVEVTELKSVVGDKRIFVYPTIIIFTMGKEAKRFERVFAMDDIKKTLERYESIIGND